MKTILTILLVLILAAEAIVWFQMRKLILGWEKEVEKEDMSLTDEEVQYVETHSKLMGILGAAALVIFLLRFVIFDLFPLFRG
jgi:hypothetical protein